MDNLILWSGWIACVVVLAAWWLTQHRKSWRSQQTRNLEAQLQEYLDGHSDDAVPALTRSMAQHRPDGVLAVLADAVPSRDSAAHARAAILVDALGLADYLAHRLQARQASDRLAAATLVSCFRWARSQMDLLDLLDDPDDRIAAAAALGLLRQVDDLPVVDGLRSLATLHQRRPLAVAAAVDELDEGGLWRLLTAWEQAPAAAAPLMQCLARRVMPVATELLATGLAHADPAARRWACAAIATHQARELLQPLRHSAENDPSLAVRLAAVDALGELTDPANLDILSRIRAHRDDAARQHAERALAAHGPEGWERLRQA